MSCINNQYFVLVNSRKVFSSEAGDPASEREEDHGQEILCYNRQKPISVEEFNKVEANLKLLSKKYFYYINEKAINPRNFSITRIAKNNIEATKILEQIIKTIRNITGQIVPNSTLFFGRNQEVVWDADTLLGDGDEPWNIELNTRIKKVLHYERV